MNLYIIALFRFHENYLMEAVELFQNLVKETRKEEGCLQYDLIEDKDHKGTFFLMELWESVEHHSGHLGKDHLLNFRREASKIMESSTEVYKGFKIY